MIIKKFKGIWFYGMSGAGKSIASKFLKKKIKRSITIDGDKVRKYVSFDLGYSIKDRKIQILRVYGLIKLAVESDIFPIASTVYMNKQIMQKLKTNKILLVRITRNFNKIKNRKNIYNNKMVDVIGKDILNPKLNKVFKIENNKTINFFKKNIERLIHER